MRNFSCVGLLGFLLVQVPIAAQADFLGEMLDFDSISVPEEGLMYDEIEPDDKPDLQEMASNSGRVKTLMRSLAHGEIDSNELIVYLNEVMEKIVAVSPFPDVKPEIHIQSSIQFDARAAPDGSIWVAVGLLSKLENEDELAFLLAHEYSHIIFEHWDSEWFERTQHYGVAVGRGLRDLHRNLASSNNIVGRRLNEAGLGADLDKWITVGTLAYKASSKILAPAWEREQEDVADAMGVDLMIRAGYDPTGAQSFLKILEGEELQALSQRQARQRTDKEREVIMEKAFFDSGLAGVLDSAWGELSDLVESELDDMSKSHYPAEDRIKELGNYLFQAHPTAVSKDPVPLQWRRSRNHPMAALIERHLEANQAGSYLNQKDIDQALAHARRAISGLGSGLSFSRLALYNVRKEQGRRDTALLNLEIALRAPYPSSHIYAAYVQHAIDDGAWEMARERLQDADQKTGGAPDLLPLKIRIYGHFGDRKAANQARIDCLDYGVQDFAEACVEASASVQSNL